MSGNNPKIELSEALSPGKELLGPMERLQWLPNKFTRNYCRYINR